MDGSSRPRAPQPAPPDRAFSFTDWQTNNPTAPPPGDKIDAELDRTNQAVEDVIEWVSTSLNSDGSLVEPPGTDPPPPTGAVAEAEEWAVVSQAWAEHMPDTIPPNILAEMAITGEHWSARWWAKQAADQVQNPDAPDDGFTYGRMAHHWEQVLPLTGGTIDGTLTVLGTPSDGAMHVRSAAEWPGTVYHIDNDTGGAFLRSNREGLARWLVYLGDDAPETGGNQGTNFKISRADDAGNEIDFPIQIDRATGQVLINGVAGGSGGSGLTPQQISALTYGVKSDYQVLPGAVSWNGTTVTVAGANFTIAPGPNNPYLIMPAGGPGGGPQIVRIVSASGTTATVDASPAIAAIGGSISGTTLTVTSTPPLRTVMPGAVLSGTGVTPGTVIVAQLTSNTGNPSDVGGDGTYQVSVSQTVALTTLALSYAFSGLAFTFGGPGLSPNNITITNPGATDARVGDVLTALGGDVIRAGTFYVSQTKVMSASVAAAGSGGAPGPVYLRGTTGHGRRVILLGNVLPDGTLDPASLSVYDAGAYWQNIAALETGAPTTNEPLSAAPFATTMPGSWVDNGSTITIGLVHPSVLPYIHLGASVTASSDTAGVVGITAQSVVTAIDSTGTVITINPPAVGAGTGNNVTFTDNLHPIGFSVTFANNSTTITATAPLPANVTVGQAISGPGLSGIGDPTDPNSTYITAIAGDGVTITISNETNEATVQPVHCSAVPYLQGVTVNLNFGVSVVSYKDWGAYRAPPAGSPPAFDTTGVHLDGTALATTVSLKASGTATSGQAYVHYGTDNTAAINAWLAAVRAASDTRGVRAIEAIGIEAVLPAGCYLTLGSVDARNIYYGNGLKFRFPGVVIHSAAENANAWNAVGARLYTMEGPLQIQGNNWFSPDIGFLLGYPDTIHLCSGLSFTNIGVGGHFKFAARVLGNVEVSTFINTQSSNARPPISALVPNYASMYDSDNLFSKFPTPQGNKGSFEGTIEFNLSSVHSGGGVPYYFHGTGAMYVLRGYAASWAMPSMFVAGNANPYLDIHCEASLPGLHLTGLSDTLFVIAPIDPTTGTGNPSSGFSGTFIDAGLFATNSLFAFDTEGHYGAPVAAWGASNAKVEINPQARSMELFDATPPGTMVGGINYNGDIFVGSVLYTASTHYHNRLGTRTGRLMLGDTSTNYSADSVNTKSVVASDQLIAGNNVQSQRGAMLSSLGFQVTDGAGMLPVYASLVRGSVSLGAVGAAGTPGTSIPFVAFHGPGNTSGTPTHKIVELTAGTLDVQGNGTNNAYVRVDGTLSIVAPLTLPNGSVAVTQAPGDNDTSVATTAFVQAAATAAAGAIVLPAPATTIPLVEGIGAPGTLTTYARADHVHPASQGAVINTQTIAAITANTITVPAGTNHIVVQDSINAVNTLTVGSGTLADGYDMWLHFSNGGSFAGVPVSAHGNLTLKVFAGGWSILAKFG